MEGKHRADNREGHRVERRDAQEGTHDSHREAVGEDIGLGRLLEVDSRLLREEEVDRVYLKKPRLYLFV